MPAGYNAQQRHTEFKLFPDKSDSSIPNPREEKSAIRRDKQEVENLPDGNADNDNDFEINEDNVDSSAIVNNTEVEKIAETGNPNDKDPDEMQNMDMPKENPNEQEKNEVDEVHDENGEGDNIVKEPDKEPDEDNESKEEKQDAEPEVADEPMEQPEAKNEQVVDKQEMEAEEPMVDSEAEDIVAPPIVSNDDLLDRTASGDEREVEDDPEAEPELKDIEPNDEAGDNDKEVKNDISLDNEYVLWESNNNGIPITTVKHVDDPTPPPLPGEKVEVNESPRISYLRIETPADYPEPDMCGIFSKPGSPISQTPISQTPARYPTPDVCDVLSRVPSPSEEAIPDGGEQFVLGQPTQSSAGYPDPDVCDVLSKRGSTTPAQYPDPDLCDILSRQCSEIPAGYPSPDLKSRPMSQRSLASARSLKRVSRSPSVHSIKQEERIPSAQSHVDRNDDRRSVLSAASSESDHFEPTSVRPDDPKDPVPPIKSPVLTVSSGKSSIYKVNRSRHIPGNPGYRVLPPIKNQPVLYRQPPKEVKSKIGSMQNINYKPRESFKRIDNYPTKWVSGPKVGSMQTPNPFKRNIHPYMYNCLPKWNKQSKVGTFDNMEHIPGGGEKKIFDEKPRWQARSKIGSLDNIDHQPLGGRVRITNNKLNWGYKSKVGSLDGLREGRQMLKDLDVYDDYVEAIRASGDGPKRWKHHGTGRIQRIQDNQETVAHRPKSKKQAKPHYEPGFMNEKLSWNSESKVGSLDNVGYRPGGGDKVIEEHDLDWDHVDSRVDADNPQYMRHPSNKKIFSEKVEWNEESKVGSLRSLHYIPKDRNVVVRQQISDGQLQEMTRTYRNIMEVRDKKIQEILGSRDRLPPIDQIINNEVTDMGSVGGSGRFQARTYRQDFEDAYQQQRHDVM